jgi:hypothetical protein
MSIGMKKGDLNRTIVDFDASIEPGPNYALAYANRGLIKTS